MTLTASDFELLLQANRILSSKLDISEVHQAMLELATKVVRAEAASYLLLDEKTNELYFDATVGSAGEKVKEFRMKLGEGLAGWVAKEQKALVVNDVSQDSRFLARPDQFTGFETHSVLAVPLRSRGRLVGVLEAINKENDGDFSPEDQEAFGVFATQAGIAMENARLFGEMKSRVEELTHQTEGHSQDSAGKTPNDHPV